MQICIVTSLGNMTAEIYAKRAPVTVAHFLQYVDAGYYSGASFYRAVRTADNQPCDKIKIDVIEGGYYNSYYARALEEDFILGRLYDEQKGRKGPLPPIQLEPTSQTGLLHVDGALTLGRTTPNAVDDALVICIGRQPELDAGGRRHPDGLGFPAFGKIVQGMDLVREIHALPTIGQKIIQEVDILSITRY